MSKPLIWLVGPSQDDCFTQAVAWLQGVSQLQRFATYQEALLQCDREAASPHAIVFCSLRPGQLATPDVEAIHRFHPLAHLAILLGSWCEGEVRSGRIIPGLRRIYWHQWRGLLPRAIGVPLEPAGFLRSPRAPRATLPRTASDADWFEAAAGQRPEPTDSKLVAVCTHRFASFDCLSEALACGGYKALWQLPHLPLAKPTADVQLWDDWPLGALAADSPGQNSVPQLLLLDFPRLEDRRRAIELGIAEIVSRPFHLSQLWTAIDAAVGRRTPAVGVCK